MGSESHASRPEQPQWVRDPGTPYEVSRLKIMEYAQAIGDPNPVYRDLDAARQAGYPDVIAPPAFAVVVALPASIAAIRDAVPGTGYPVIVHVEQRFEYARPIRAGDVLDAESAVIGIRELRGAVMVTTRTEIRGADGEQICSVQATLAKLPAAAKNDPPPAPTTGRSSQLCTRKHISPSTGGWSCMTSRGSSSAGKCPPTSAPDSPWILPRPAAGMGRAPHVGIRRGRFGLSGSAQVPNI